MATSSAAARARKAWAEIGPTKIDHNHRPSAAAVSAETADPFVSALRISYTVAGALCVTGIWFSLARGRIRRGTAL